MFWWWILAHSFVNLQETSFSNLKVLKMTFQSSCEFIIILSSSFTFCSLVSMAWRDLHCNPVKVVVSGKVLFVPGGRKWSSLRDWVSRGWRGISHSVPFRTDVSLSSPSSGCLSWQPKKACAHPTVPTAQLKKVCSVPFLNKWAQI